jgi:hypothetical protein
MTRKQIFLKRVLPVLGVFILSLGLSFFYIYNGYYYAPSSWWWAYSGYYNYFLWQVIFSSYRVEFVPVQVVVAYIHLFTILFSLYLIITRSREVNNFVGFPSIKAAKKYMKEKRRLKKLEKKYINKQKIEDAKVAYLKKMQHLEEEKKKYL